jgi:hypothetical protein
MSDSTVPADTAGSTETSTVVPQETPTHGTPVTDGQPPRGDRRRSAGRRAALLAAPLAVLASGALVYQASNAAFTATTSNAGNSWTAGNVYLSDSQNGTALFNVSNVTPGAANKVSKCIKVSYTGNLAANIRLYMPSWTSTARTNPTAGSELIGDYLQAIIQDGTGNNADCSDFVANAYLTSGTTNGETLKTFRTGYSAWANPGTYDGNAVTWSVSGAATKTFKISYWLPDLGENGAPTTNGSFGSLQARYDDIQGSSLSTGFTWEARSS